MNQVIGILIILIGFAIAYWMDFSLVSDLIALGALFLGGKIAGFQIDNMETKKMQWEIRCPDCGELIHYEGPQISLDPGTIGVPNA